jgi:sulfide:quinone oxidoreductase
MAGGGSCQPERPPSAAARWRGYSPLLAGAPAATRFPPPRPPVPVGPLTFETRFPSVYAVGDVTSVGTPKAGVFAEGQAKVVAAEIAALLQGGTTSRTYDGRGACYIEFGAHRVARIDVTFMSGQRPTGSFDEPSEAFVADKDLLGSSRIGRWFGEGTTSG